jgi:hypothetical protein
MYMRQRRTRRTRRRGGGNPADAQRRRGMLFDQLNPDATDSDDDDEFLSGPSLTDDNLHGMSPLLRRNIRTSTRDSRRNTSVKAKAFSSKEGSAFAGLDGGRRQRRTRRRRSRKILRRR